MIIVKRVAQDGVGGESRSEVVAARTAGTDGDEGVRF